MESRTDIPMQPSEKPSAKAKVKVPVTPSVKPATKAPEFTDTDNDVNSDDDLPPTSGPRSILADLHIQLQELAQRQKELLEQMAKARREYSQSHAAIPQVEPDHSWK